MRKKNTTNRKDVWKFPLATSTEEFIRVYTHKTASVADVTQRYKGGLYRKKKRKFSSYIRMSQENFKIFTLTPRKKPGSLFSDNR